MSSSLKNVRLKMREFLADLIRIDSFQLDVPPDLYSDASTSIRTLPANTLREFPVENLSYNRTNFNSVTGNATFSYSLIFRYAGEIPYQDLPIPELESLVEYIQVSTILSPPDCNIKLIEVDPVEASVNPQRDGTTQEDWFVFCNFSFQISFEVKAVGLSPDFGTPPGDLIPDGVPTVVEVYKSESIDDLGTIGNDRLDATFNFNF